MKTKKQLNLALIITYSVGIILVNLVLSPIITVYGSNIIYKESLFLDIFSIIREILLYLYYPLAYSLIIYSIYNFSFEANKSALIIPLIFTPIKTLSNFIMDSILIGYSSALFYPLIIYTLIDAAQIFFVVLLSRKLISPALEVERTKKKASEALGKEYEEKVYLPFTAVVDKTNPVLVSTFWASAVISLINIAIRLIIYIELIIDSIIQQSGIFETVFELLKNTFFDFVQIGITYLIISFLLILFLPKEKKSA